jgi:NADH-quinone oxidoreductase subunit A
MSHVLLASDGAIATSLGIVAYFALFFGAGFLFVFVNLLIGRFVRPDNPHEEKLEIYECGEPSIGSSFVQFDLRFYVVALLFIIFDVEVAFFFPWAAVFGKATNMSEPGFAVVQGTAPELQLTPAASDLYKELGVRGNPTVPTSIPPSLEGQISATSAADEAEQIIKKGSRQLALLSIADIAVFFGVLMMGFFYVWKRGDLDWVRAVSRHESVSTELEADEQVARGEPALSI